MPFLRLLLGAVPGRLMVATSASSYPPLLCTASTTSPLACRKHGNAGSESSANGAAVSSRLGGGCALPASAEVRAERISATVGGRGSKERAQELHCDVERIGYAGRLLHCARRPSAVAFMCEPLRVFGRSCDAHEARVATFAARCARLGINACLRVAYADTRQLRVSRRLRLRDPWHSRRSCH